MSLLGEIWLDQSLLLGKRRAPTKIARASVLLEMRDGSLIECWLKPASKQRTVGGRILTRLVLQKIDSNVSKSWELMLDSASTLSGRS